METFSLHLCNLDRSRRFVIAHTGGLGWEVREEVDHAVVRVSRYRDWHRVERARMAIDRVAAELKQSGWVEA